MVLVEQPLPDHFRGFAAVVERDGGTTYPAICRAVAEDDEVLSLLDGAPLPQRRPLLLLAAVHFLLLSGVEHALAPMFAGRPRDVTEENVQSRARGLILMSISNKFGAMVVTTGNKSEMSVGYATLYGDMNGGFNPIKDVYKTEVFRLAELRNRWKPAGAKGPGGIVIPPEIITRPPTAELRENQKDQDSLPPYPTLDAILYRLVEKEMRLSDIVAEGFDAETVRRIEGLLYLAEYKRRQSAPGVKVGSKNFGRDRRYPIVNRFRDSVQPAQTPDASIAPRGAQGTSERFED